MSKTHREPDEPVQADLLPVMNVMFLLIPALLLAMEFASMAQIAVRPPGAAAHRSPDPIEVPKPALEFKVQIARDGFSAGPERGQSTQIPLASGEHDFAALARYARDLKAAYPDEAAVTVTAEGDVSMDLLVRTLDVLRGDQCKLAGYARGEAPGPDCLFWSPLISSHG